MYIDDLFSLTTAHLVKASGDTYARVAKELEILLENYELRQPQKPKTFSVAGTDADGHLLGYWAWIKTLRSLDVTSARIEGLPPESSMSPRIAAAFANGALKILKLQATSKTFAYMTVTRFSRSTALTGADLELILDVQFSDTELKNRLWQEVLEQTVRNFGEYSAATSIEDARFFFRDHYERFFCPANEVLRTAQYFCFAQKRQFQIPRKLAAKLEKRQRNTYDIFANNMPYVEDALLPVEIVALVDFQMDATVAWQKVLEQFVFLSEPLEMRGRFTPEMKIEKFRSEVLKLSAEELTNFPMGNVVLAIGSEFKIPSELKDKFVFPEQPLIPDHELWVASANPEPWQMLVFQNVGEEPSQAFEPRMPIVLNKFILSLEAAEKFARLVQSPFTEAFSSALAILRNESIKFDDAQLLAKTAQKAGLSEKTLEVLDRTLALQLCMALQQSESYRRIALAAELASVFGGMGSWNDQAFEQQDLHAHFTHVSNDLYQSLSQVKAALAE